MFLERSSEKGHYVAGSGKLMFGIQFCTKSSIVSIFRGNVKASGSAVSWKELNKAIPANLKGTVQGEQQSINPGN